MTVSRATNSYSLDNIIVWLRQGRSHDFWFGGGGIISAEVWATNCRSEKKIRLQRALSTGQMYYWKSKKHKPIASPKGLMGFISLGGYILVLGGFGSHPKPIPGYVPTCSTLHSLTHYQGNYSLAYLAWRPVNPISGQLSQCHSQCQS